MGEKVFDSITSTVNISMVAGILLGLTLFTLTLDFLLGRLDKLVKVYIHYQLIVYKVYKELMTLGVVSLGVFIVKEILPSEYGEVILVLELVHFLVFLVAVVYVCYAISYTLNLRRVKKRWDIWNRIDPSDLGSLYEHARNSPLYWFSEVRRQVDFHLAKDAFLDIHNLARNFDFAKYLRKGLTKETIRLLDIGPISWLMLMALIGIVWLFEAVLLKDQPQYGIVLFLISDWILMFIGLGIVVILWVGRRKLVTQSSRHLRDEFAMEHPKEQIAPHESTHVSESDKASGKYMKRGITMSTVLAEYKYHDNHRRVDDISELRADRGFAKGQSMPEVPRILSTPSMMDISEKPSAKASSLDIPPHQQQDSFIFEAPENNGKEATEPKIDNELKRRQLKRTKEVRNLKAEGGRIEGIWPFNKPKWIKRTMEFLHLSQCFYLAILSLMITYKTVVLFDPTISWLLIFLEYFPSALLLFWILPYSLSLFAFLKFTTTIDGHLYGEVVNRMEKVLKLKLKLLKLMSTQFDDVHSVQEQMLELFKKMSKGNKDVLTKEKLSEGLRSMGVFVNKRELGRLFLDSDEISYQQLIDQLFNDDTLKKHNPTLFGLLPKYNAQTPSKHLISPSDKHSEQNQTQTHKVLERAMSDPAVGHPTHPSHATIREGQPFATIKHREPMAPLNLPIEIATRLEQSIASESSINSNSKQEISTNISLNTTTSSNSD